MKVDLQPGRLIHQRLTEDGSWEETEGWLDYDGNGTIRLHVGPPPDPEPDLPASAAPCLMQGCPRAVETDGLCGDHHRQAYPEKMDVIHQYMAHEHERHQRAIDTGAYRQQWDHYLHPDRTRLNRE